LRSPRRVGASSCEHQREGSRQRSRQGSRQGNRRANEQFSDQPPTSHSCSLWPCEIVPKSKPHRLKPVPPNPPAPLPQPVQFDVVPRAVPGRTNGATATPTKLMLCSLLRCLAHHKCCLRGSVLEAPRLPRARGESRHARRIFPQPRTRARLSHATFSRNLPTQLPHATSLATFRATFRRTSCSTSQQSNRVLSLIYKRFSV
jgi:hypothetical protein